MAKKVTTYTATDHETLEEFVRALANATEYKTHPLGFHDSISNYWKEEAAAWVYKLDAPPDPCYCQSDETCTCP